MKHNKYDLIVVGLGTAGAIALIRAARLGLRVLGIEKLNRMGGTGTAGGIGAYYYGSRGGFFEEINKKTAEFQAQYFTEAHFPLPEAKAFVLEGEAIAANAEFIYNSCVIDVELVRKRLVGITVLVDGNTKEELRASLFMDTTGEGELARLCGCAMHRGRSFDSQTQPYTNSQIILRESFTAVDNRDAGYIDTRESEAFSNEVIRANTLPIYLKPNYSVEKGEMVFMSPSPIQGMREGDLLDSLEDIDFDMVTSGKKTDKPIFYAYSNIDSHTKDIAFEDRSLKDWYVAAGLWSVNASVGVPMGSLIPKEHRGLIVGGRSLGVKHNVASLFRMKSDMEKCGEAMADMAYLAARGSCDYRDIDYGELAEMLRATGCLDKANDIGYTNRIEGGNEAISMITDTAALKTALSGRLSGIAIWSAKLLGEAVRDSLAAWLDEAVASGEDFLAKNCAISLALLDDEKALPLLRDAVDRRDRTIPKTGYKNVQHIGITAVYLLGRLGDVDSLQRLCDVILSGGEFDRTDFESSWFYYEADDVSFQYITFALTAIGDICALYPEKLSEVSEKLADYIYSDSFNLSTTLKFNPQCRIDLTEKFRSYARMIGI